VAKESGLNGRRFGDSASAPTRLLGQHPAGGEVVIKAGRYGPYVKYGKVNATLPPGADATTLTLEEAISLIAAKQAGHGSKGAVQGRLLGNQPNGEAVTVRAGRFGPYVNRGKTNAPLRNGMTPETITLEEAITLIDEKESAAPRSRPKKTTEAAPRANAKRAAAPPKEAAESPAQKSKRAKRA
jgi:DNA topoisomerase I